MSKKVYYPFIDGIRAIAILQVLVLQGLDFKAVYDIVMSGWIGVDTFFVISGYLITLLLFKEQGRFGNINLRKFLLRRFFRIAPAYYLSLLAAGLYYWLVKHEFYDQFWWSFFLLADFAMGHGFTPVRDYLIHTWSLGVEVKFYLMWPLLLKHLRTNYYVVVLAVILVEIALRYWFIQSGAPYTTLRFSFLWHCDSLAFGALAAIMSIRHRWPAGVLNIPAIVGNVTFFLFVISSFTMPREHRVLDTFVWCIRLPLHCILVAAVLFLGTAQSGAFYVRVLQWNVLRWIGRISYSLYAWHLVVFDSTLSLMPLLPVKLDWHFVKFGMVLLVGEASYRWIEQPAIKWGRRWSKRRK